MLLLGGGSGVGPGRAGEGVAEEKGPGFFCLGCFPCNPATDKQ